MDGSLPHLFTSYRFLFFSAILTLKYLNIDLAIHKKPQNQNFCWITNSKNKFLKCRHFANILLGILKSSNLQRNLFNSVLKSNCFEEFVQVIFGEGMAIIWLVKFLSCPSAMVWIFTTSLFFAMTYYLNT